jgi:hypothetical protein
VQLSIFLARVPERWNWKAKKADKMTLSEFAEKPVLAEDDAEAVLRDTPFDDICAYIENGPDVRVSELLKGLWATRSRLSQDEILRAVVCALFPPSAWMRFGSAVVAVRLAKATGYERQLQDIIRSRWSSMDARGCHELVLGLSGDIDGAGWLGFLSLLFEENPDVAVRAQILKVVNCFAHSKELRGADQRLTELLNRMPDRIEDYSNPGDYQFITRLKS